MGANFTAFQAWEKVGPYVHAMVTDRGNLSAANRLTVTDRPYRDAGPVGSRYHDTYSAPVQAIISDITTRETEAGTSFGDIVLVNEGGRFNSIMTDANILRQQFIMYRFPPSMSLASVIQTSVYELFRGEVSGVLFEDGGKKVRLKITPIKYQYDRVFGSPTEPILHGKCRQVEFTLVNSGTNEYRCATNILAIDADSTFIVRDSGVVLANPADYTRDQESGKWKGKITLTGGSPTGKLTADANWLDTSTVNVGLCWLNVCREVFRTYLVPDYDKYDDALDLSAVGTGTFQGICKNSAGTKLYAIDSNETIHQYSVTSYDAPSASSDAKTTSVDPNARLGGLVNSGATLFLFSPINDQIWTETLSTPEDIFTSSDDANNTDITSDLNDSLADIWVPEDGTYLLALDLSGYLYHFDMSTPYDPATLQLDPSKTQNFEWVGINLESVEVSPDGAYLYLCDYYSMHQFEFMDSEDITSLVFTKRSYYPGYGRSAGDYVLANNGLNWWLLEDATGEGGIYQFIMDDQNMLPYSTLWWNVDPDYMFSYPDMFLNRETAVREMIDIMAKAVGATSESSPGSGWGVDRYGQIQITLNLSATTLQTWESYFPVGIKDFFGTGGGHIKHVARHEAAENIITKYDKRHVIQSSDELAGSVSDDDRQLWSVPYSTTTKTNTLSDYRYSRDIVVDTFMTDSSNFNDGETLANDLKTLWATAHNEYELSLSIKPFSLLSDFGVGSKIEANGDWLHPDFSDGDHMFVVGRDVNWTKNTQTVRVFT